MQRVPPLPAAAPWRGWLLQGLVLLGLAACGGGGSDGASSPSAARSAAMSPQAPPPSSRSATTNAPTFDVVVLDANGTALPSGINATGQVAFTSLLGGPAASARFYNGTSIQQILGAGDALSTVAMNDLGQVTGGFRASEGISHAFRWTPTGSSTSVLVDLGAPADGSSTGAAINALGQVAGVSVGPGVPGFEGPQHAFLWTEGAGMVDLGTLPAPFLSSSAFFLNASGQVAGLARTTVREPTVHSFFWTAVSGMRDLGTLGGSNATARALNELGQVAGASDTFNGQQHAFWWSATGGMVDLGTLGGGTSNAFGLNNSGQVVGQADTGAVGGPVLTSPFHAFLRSLLGPSAGAMVDLGTLGGDSSVATAINDAGQVVGGTETQPGQPFVGFLWTRDGGMVDLNTRIPTAPAGLTVHTAVAIAQNGSILANSSAGLVLLKPSERTSFVTAAISITSPAGAYKKDPAVTGRARFIALARPDDAGARPSGRTRFDVSAASLDFESTSYDWLNLQGNRAQYQGKGTINGSGDYRFLVTAIDRSGNGPDRLRMKIWHVEAATGGMAVDYDNQTDPATEGTIDEGSPSEGGNIVVH